MRNQDYLFDYQRKVVEFEGRTLICNWSRGLGLTYTLARLILENRPKNVIYVSKAGLRQISDKIKEVIKLTDSYHLFDDVYSDVNTKDHCIKIKYANGDIINILSPSYAQAIGYNKINYDYILFDGLLPFNIRQNAEHVVSMVTVSNHDKHLQRLYGSDTEVFEVDYKTGIKCGLICVVSMHSLKTSDLERFCSEYAILDNPTLLARKLELDDKLSNVNIELRRLEKELQQ